MTTVTWSLTRQVRSAMELELMGATRDEPRPDAITAPGDGGKFDLDGRVMDFPGNTFLCHIDRNSDFYRASAAYQEALMADPLAAGCLTFLPQPSFHMTVFCGVSGMPLGGDGWPRDIPAGSDLTTITATYLDRLSALHAPAGFRVQVAGFHKPGSLTMLPDGAEEEAGLRGLRRDLERLTGIYRGDVDSYRFHVSLAYQLRWLSPSETSDLIDTAERLYAQHFLGVGPVHLGPTEFCAFQNMHHFETIARI